MIQFIYNDLQYLVIRGIISLTLFIFTVIILFMLGLHLLGEIKKVGWYERIGNRAAIGLFVWLFGRAISQVWGWVLISASTHGENIVELENRFPLAFVGAGSAVWGALCLIGVFAPAKWKWWSIIGSIIIATLFIVGFGYLSRKYNFFITPA